MHSNDKERLYELVGHYLSQTLSGLEDAELNDLLKDAHLNREFQRILANTEATAKGVHYSNFSLKRGRKLLKSKIERYEGTARQSAVSRSSRSRFSRYAVAAAFILATTSTLSLLKHYGVWLPEQKEDWQIFSTNNSQKLTLSMTDGSKIVLNANSELKCSRKFGQSDRVLHLTGEAYFDVASDMTKPFVVHTGPLATRVLGTKFNVQAFPGEDQIVVALVEGKVDVIEDEALDGSSHMILKPRERVYYNSISRQMRVDTFDEVAVIGWKDNIFKFENIPLADIFRAIEHNYGVSITIQDEAYLDTRYTTNISQSTLWTMVKVIGRVAHLQYHVTTSNDSVMIHFHR